MPAGLDAAAVAAARAAVAARHGPDAAERAAAGIARAAACWRPADGPPEDFAALCAEHWIEEAGDRARLLERLELAIAAVDGQLFEIRRDLRRWVDLEGAALPAVDGLLAVFDPAPGLTDQWFSQRLAFVALLHFAPPDLAAMLAGGPTWSDDDWAAARVAQRFGARLSAELGHARRAAWHRADAFVSGQHVGVGNLVDGAGRRWLAPDRTLVAHWLIREAIRDGYRSTDAADGLDRQRALAWVMRRTVDGTLPRDQLGARADADWDAAANTLGGRAVAPEAQLGPERYARWLEIFHVARAEDAEDPASRSAIARACDRDREIAADDVERLLVALLEAPERAVLDGWLAGRLGRALEPFDIYFDAAVPSADAAALDARVAERFPDAAALQAGLPDILGGLGFSGADAAFLAAHIRVEIARGAGHAMPSGTPERPVWLRTNGRGGRLDWAGFDIAMHELGHNVEQLISLHHVPRPALRGVPNTACSEAFAFLFQAEARRVLGVAGDDARLAAATTLETALAAIQIAGPALLELEAWRWLYAHPDADAAALQAAVLALADGLWQRHYAAAYGPDPYALLAAYQHMIAYPLYLPNYAIGHIVSHQIRRHLAGGDLAAEARRICAIGRVTPALWLERAVGAPLDARRLLADAAGATALLG